MTSNSADCPSGNVTPMTEPQPAIILGITATATASVTRGPETLRRIAAGELNPDGTPATRDEPGRDGDDDAHP